MNKRSKLLVSATGLGLVLAGLGVTSAHADPSGPPTPRILNGVGSDTTTPVMNALSQAITINGQKVISSWDATGPAFSYANPTSGGAPCSFSATGSTTTPTRPNGSGAGRAALLNSLNNTGVPSGCLQFGRASALNLTASTPSLTYVPFATDGVTFAYEANSTAIPKSLNLSDLQQIYQCNSAFVGTGPNWLIQPVLPQPGSGTRSFWEGEMGITDADVLAGKYPCITDTDSKGNLIEEQTGTWLQGNQLVPFSIASYDAEESGAEADARGFAVLGAINGVLPQEISAGQPVTRQVYNVIPTADTGTAPWSTVFVGTSSLICTNSAIIAQYGFLPATNCGDTSQHS